MIVILWIIVFFVFFFYVVVGYEFFFYFVKVMCVYNLESLFKGYGVFLVFVYVVVLLILIIVCYIRVFIKVWKYNLNFIFWFWSSCRFELLINWCLLVDEVNVIYIFLVVVIGFLVCWMFVVVIDLIDFFNLDWKFKW